MRVLVCLLLLLGIGVHAISPRVKCTVKRGQLCGARWGYVNEDRLLFIPHGPGNRFEFGSEEAKGFGENRPILFLPGSEEAVFQVEWDCRLGPITWVLDDFGHQRRSTALNINTCDCGTGCLQGTTLNPIITDPDTISYSPQGSHSCEIQHYILDLDGCEPIERIGNRGLGPCSTPEFIQPYKISGKNISMTFGPDIKFALDTIYIHSQSVCSACETYVPKCAPRSTESTISTMSTVLLPSTSTTTQPVPSEPIPSELLPTEPISSEPIPSEPISSEPPPSTEPIPSEPPTTIEPIPSEPIPIEPLLPAPVVFPRRPPPPRVVRKVPPGKAAPKPVLTTVFTMSVMEWVSLGIVLAISGLVFVAIGLLFVRVYNAKEHRKDQ